MSVIEDAIARYSKGDDAYANKLKSHFRDAMGFSNYVSRIGQETAGPSDIGSVKGLSPAGVNARINTRFNMQDQNVNTLGQIAGGIDTAAGGLAAEQVAREKAARSAAGNKMGFENGVVFSPKDDLDQAILAYMQNPKNPDGSVKSLQQFEAEQSQKYGSQYSGDQKLYPNDYVNSRIAERVPKDFIGNEDKYFLMSQGYSSKQAEENAGALKRAQMTPEEQLAWDNAHPVMSKILSAMGNDTSLINDVGVTTDQATGEMKPKYTLPELIQKHPGVDPKIIEAQAKPVFQNLLIDDLQQEKFVKDMQTHVAQMGKNLSVNDYAEFMDSDEYKAFKQAIIPVYGGMFTPAEIDTVIYNKIMGGL